MSAKKNWFSIVGFWFENEEDYCLPLLVSFPRISCCDRLGRSTAEGRLVGALRFMFGCRDGSWRLGGLGVMELLLAGTSLLLYSGALRCIGAGAVLSRLIVRCCGMELRFIPGGFVICWRDLPLSGVVMCCRDWGADLSTRGVFR